MATIGGKENLPSGIGTVKWTWKDNNRRPHTHLVRNDLYFPHLPVNILSITSFANQLGNDEWTGIHTKSIFHWDNKQHQRTIIHPQSNLPTMPINEGFVLSSLCSQIVSTSVNLLKHHCHCLLSSLLPSEEHHVIMQDSE